MIDRLSPTKRPSGKPVGYQQWNSLLFMHWEVPLATVRPLVPGSLEIDTYEGKAYVGLVPFAMRSVRPHWAPKILGFNFLETNVRTYVTHDNQPGVYFFSLDAASRIAVWVARQFWSLPYFYAQMQLERNENTIRYRSTRNHTQASLDITCKVGPALEVLEPDSLDFFFLERYLLFLEHRQQLYWGQVHHTPYPAHQAEVLELHDQLLPAAGFEGHENMPEFVHYSPGVDVEIFKLQKAKQSCSTKLHT